MNYYYYYMNVQYGKVGTSAGHGANEPEYTYVGLQRLNLGIKVKLFLNIKRQEVLKFAKLE